MHTVWVIKLFLLIVEVNCKVSYNYSSEFMSPVSERQKKGSTTCPKTQTVCLYLLLMVEVNTCLQRVSQYLNSKYNSQFNICEYGLVVSVGCRSLSAKSSTSYIFFSISHSTFRVFLHLGLSIYSVVVTLLSDLQHCECNFWPVLNEPILIQRIIFSIRNWLMHVRHTSDSKFLACV